MTLDAASAPPAPDDAGAADTAPETMTAVAVTRIGDASAWRAIETPIPVPGPGQVLVRVLSAGFGHWDVLEREGRLGSAGASTVPFVGGSEGAGTVVEVGADVHRFREGDRVCGLVLARRPGHGFHAQFTLVDADLLWRVPAGLPLQQAAALPVDGGLAMHAVDAALRIVPGDAVLVLGASGGIGHMALQFARLRGGRVLAVASHRDGQALAERLGADMAIDGRRHDLAAALRIFAPEGLDAVLLTADVPCIAETVVAALRPGGRIAWPHGVRPPPIRADIAATGFGARAGAAHVHAACRAIERGPFHLHLGTRLPLSQIAGAAQALAGHHLGRIVLDVP